MKKKVYVLRNDELGYVSSCPAYKNKEDAEREAAFKCRLHSVVEREVDLPTEGCTPPKPHGCCFRCAILIRKS